MKKILMQCEICIESVPRRSCKRSRKDQLNEMEDKLNKRKRLKRTILGPPRSLTSSKRGQQELNLHLPSPKKQKSCQGKKHKSSRFPNTLLNFSDQSLETIKETNHYLEKSYKKNQNH